MERLKVIFEDLPLARWGPLFHILRIEHPTLRLEWEPVGFPVAGADRLAGADVGLLVQPPPGEGLSLLALETSPMVVLVAAGHRLGRTDELRVDDVLAEPFPAGPDHDPEWRAFWTLDEQRGGPPLESRQAVEGPREGLAVIAAGHAIGTAPAPLAHGLSHPGIVSIPLVDGPSVSTCLVWRSDDPNPLVGDLVDLACHLTGRDSPEPS